MASVEIVKLSRPVELTGPVNYTDHAEAFHAGVQYEIPHRTATYAIYWVNQHGGQGHEWADDYEDAKFRAHRWATDRRMQGAKVHLLPEDGCPVDPGVINPRFG
jgi:hypothetical protein